MIVLWTAMACPPVLAGLGIWLETLGTMEDAWDEFFSRWPLAAIGSAIGALTALHA